MKGLSKQSIKLLWKDFQKKINYLKIKKNDKNAIEYFSKPNNLATTKQIMVEQLLL